MDVEARVLGVPGAVEALNELPPNIGVNTFRGAIRFAVQPAIEDAKRLVTYTGNEDGDDYSLRDNISARLTPIRERRRIGTQASYRIGAHRLRRTAPDAGGYLIAGGLSTARDAPNYARIEHDRTQFLKRAFDRNQAGMLRRFAQQLVKITDRTVARLRRKADRELQQQKQRNP